MTMLALIAFLSLTFVSGLYIDNYLYSKRLIENRINSVITDVAHFNRGGYQYMYDESYFWASSFNLDTEKELLFVGDSIAKSPNSLYLKVYRKNRGLKYLHVATFKGSN